MSPSPIVIREASFSNRWKHIHTHTQILGLGITGESCIREVKRIFGARGVKDITRKPTKSTNLGAYELKESDLTTGSQHGTD